MKIISLRAENIKKLVAVEIKPDGNVVEITGRNGQGKTSVLDSIWWALGGLGNVQTAPIRAGQEEGRIHLDLGEIRVVRTFRQVADEGGKAVKVTSSISVYNADGSKFSSPQAMLDGLVGALSFDPLAFSRMDPAAQFRELSRFVPDVDFDAIDRANKADYDKRTDANRRAREAKVLADKIQVPADGPVQPVDESALIDQLEKSSATNTDITTRKNNRDQMAKKAMTNRQEAERLVKEAETIEKRLAEAAALPEPVDVAALRQKIAEAQEINSDVARRAEKQRHLATAREFTEIAATYTAAMELREEAKRDKIAGAVLPVAGLGFGEGCITLGGVPFNQASDAEQLRVSIAIAMAANPKLRVIRVRDGSLLDDHSMQLLAGMAKDRDYQVWVETVNSSGRVGFTLEDGHLKVKEAAAK